MSTFRVLSSAIAVCAACLCGLAGCAAVTVIDANGVQDISLQPFKFEAVTRPAHSPALVSVTTFGISTTAEGFDVGLKTADIVTAPPKCHAIMVVRTEAQADTAARLAKVVDRSCIVQR